jgi:hypothetical protein
MVHDGTLGPVQTKQTQQGGPLRWPLQSLLTSRGGEDHSKTANSTGAMISSCHRNTTAGTTAYQGALHLRRTIGVAHPVIAISQFCNASSLIVQPRHNRRFLRLFQRYRQILQSSCSSWRSR